MVKPIDMSVVENALAGFTIPPQPEVLLRIKQEIELDDPDINTIATLINMDIGIAGFTLKVVNSAYFGLRRKISSIEHACKFLGLNRVIKLVTSVVLRFTLSGGQTDPFINRLWNSAMNVGSAAMLIALHLRYGSDCADDCYSVGLFHNAGMTLIHAQYPDYAKVLKVGLQNGFNTAAVEQRYFHTSHELLGFMIAQSWGLAPELGRVIAYHHTPDEALQSTDLYEKRLFAILKLAEHLTSENQQLLELSDEREWEHYGQAILDVLELDEMQLPDIADYLLENGIDNQFHR
jgi:HD-like signal output (HDOD) protein